MTPDPVGATGPVSGGAADDPVLVAPARPNPLAEPDPGASPDGLDGVGAAGSGRPVRSGRPADGADEPVRRRMRGDDRKRQLLDAAATIIVEHGASAMSMERLAQEAGVSKALPYKHFDNSEDVLAELYRRETAALGRQVWQALSEAEPGADLIRLSLRVYFDEVSRRGPILAALSAPGSTIPSVADAGQAGVTFEVEVFNRFHGLDRERSKQVAGMIQGAVVGATGTWLAGHGTRDQLEDDLVAMITSLVRQR